MRSAAILHGRHTMGFLSKVVIFQLCLIIYLMFPPRMNTGFQNDKINSQESDGCTVVIQAYNKNRFVLLRQILYPYENAPFVKYIVIKTNYSITDLAVHLSKTRRLKILSTDILSLNSRFAIPYKFQSVCNIIADDDIFIEPQELSLIYQVWHRNQDKLVGPFVRLVSEDSSIQGDQLAASNTKNKLVYQDSSLEYNIVLTKLMILHNKFLEHYLSKGMGKLRSIVDKFRNCEDIAINFSATILHGSPMHVDANPGDLGDSRNSGRQFARFVAHGIGARQSHWDTRQVCSNELYHVLNRLPLIQTQTVTRFKGEHSLCWKGTERVYCRDHS